VPGAWRSRALEVQRLLRLSLVGGTYSWNTGGAAITDVGLVMIIAWILGALQVVLLRELTGALGTYVKLRARERIRFPKIMSSYGPRAPWV